MPPTIACRRPGPSPAWRSARPPGFRFTVKLPAAATHERTRDPAVFEAFLDAVAPLEEAGKLHGFLAQFPYSFRPGEESHAHLRFLRDTLGAAAALRGVPPRVVGATRDLRVAGVAGRRVLRGRRAAAAGALPARGAADRAGRLRPLPRAQRRRLVERGRLRPLRLPVQRPRAGGVGRGDPPARGPQPRHVRLLQQLPRRARGRRTPAGWRRLLEIPLGARDGESGQEAAPGAGPPRGKAAKSARFHSTEKRIGGQLPGIERAASGAGSSCRSDRRG